MKIDKEEMSGKGRPTWWRQFWVGIAISVSDLIVAQCAAYVLGYIDLFKLFGGVLVLLLTIPLAYTVWHIQTKYQHSKAVHVMNKLAFILGGAFIAFPLTMFAIIFTILATGATEPFSSLGPWLTIILLLVVPMTIGALIGYLIGKRRNYRPFL